MILDLYAQMVLHSAVSALGMEAFLALWGVREPAQRWRYRLLAVLLPVLTVPAFRLLDSSWGSPAFRAGEALFDSRRWLDLSAGGVTGRMAVGAVFAGGILGFFLQELRPLIRETWQEKSPRRAPAEYPHLAAALASWRNISPGDSPALEIIDAEEPMSKCKGGKQARVVLSSGLLQRVDEKELLGILAHEGAHLRKRDHQYGWALLVLRILHAANPIGLLVFRKLGEENENWCDDFSVAATGDPLSLASALVHLYRGTLTNARPPLKWYGSGGRALGARARAAVIVARIERLMKPRPAGSGRQLEPWRLGAAGISLAILLFRVV